jgi:mono/diheme cytochrome c family protein
MGPGMRQNFGMMSDNLNQMHQMMGQGYMAPGHYGQTMGMMGQMGTMMHEMGGPSYPPEVEQRHRAQLQEMRERLGAMKSQAAAPGGERGGGARLFEVQGAACHAGFGNAMYPDLPIRGSRQLANFAVFRDFVRHPRLPEGSRGAMPGFTPAQISDSRMQELYQYLISQVGK